mgnify:CR=1 FL=1
MRLQGAVPQLSEAPRRPVLPAVPTAVEPEEALRLLGAATDLRPIGRLAEASNATFLCELIGVEPALQVVYKPIRGEAPLWDFPTGTLAGREVAAAMLSTALGDRKSTRLNSSHVALSRMPSSA